MIGCTSWVGGDQEYPEMHTYSILFLANILNEDTEKKVQESP
jgi:hypothetical protein